MHPSLDRLGVFYFVPFLPNVVLSPLDHPSLRALRAKDRFEEYYALGGKPMTSGGLWPATIKHCFFLKLVHLEWLVERSKLVGTKRVIRQERGPRDVLEDIHFRYNPSWANQREEATQNYLLAYFMFYWNRDQGLYLQANRVAGKVARRCDFVRWDRVEQIMIWSFTFLFPYVTYEDWLNIFLYLAVRRFQGHTMTTAVTWPCVGHSSEGWRLNLIDPKMGELWRNIRSSDTPQENIPGTGSSQNSLFTPPWVQFHHTHIPVSDNITSSWIDPNDGIEGRLS